MQRPRWYVAFAYYPVEMKNFGRFQQQNSAKRFILLFFCFYIFFVYLLFHLLNDEQYYW